MKMINTLMLVLGIALAACSERGIHNESHVGPSTELKHEVSQCPSIRGDYQKSSTERKSFLYESEVSGIKFVDSELQFIVNGASHPLIGSEGMTYKAACEHQMILIDIYEGETYLGRMKYSIPNPGQLLIEVLSLDSRIGKSNVALWQATPSVIGN